MSGMNGMKAMSAKYEEGGRELYVGAGTREQGPHQRNPSRLAVLLMVASIAESARYSHSNFVTLQKALAEADAPAGDSSAADRARAA